MAAMPRNTIPQSRNTDDRLKANGFLEGFFAGGMASHGFGCVHSKKVETVSDDLADGGHKG